MLCFYLRGNRFHFAFFVLLVGSQVDGELIVPPVDGLNTDVSGEENLLVAPTRHVHTDPLMIALLSPRMKISCSDVVTQSAFFWPVLGSASAMSVHRLMLTVP